MPHRISQRNFRCNHQRAYKVDILNTVIFRTKQEYAKKLTQIERLWKNVAVCSFQENATLKSQKMNVINFATDLKFAQFLFKWKYFRHKALSFSSSSIFFGLKNDLTSTKFVQLRFCHSISSIQHALSLSVSRSFKISFSIPHALEQAILLVRVMLSSLVWYVSYYRWRHRLKFTQHSYFNHVHKFATEFTLG